ncbi:MAG: VOC family protein [Nitrososphaerota archaeon]|nr:VOC family protein [Nitrososphaerota archaeon]
MMGSDNKTDNGAGIGAVGLIVADVQAEAGFYRDLGLKIRKDAQENGSKSIELGTSSITMLKLVESKNALKPARTMAGLYHIAIRLPERKALGEVYQRIRLSSIPFEGFADHGVSEALYLSDLEGNGIEIYSDRPKETWQRDGNGRINMGTEPLDIDSLLRGLEQGDKNRENQTMPEGTRIGHVHLKVTNLKRSIEFYAGVLGMDVMQQIHSAAFLSYNGYHHHVGLNTWESLGGQKREDGFLGLDHFTVLVDKRIRNKFASLNIQHEREVQTTDPDGIKLNLVLV